MINTSILMIEMTRAIGWLGGAKSINENIINQLNT